MKLSFLLVAALSLIVNVGFSQYYYHPQLTGILQGLFDYYHVDLGDIPNCYADKYDIIPFGFMKLVETLPAYQTAIMEGNLFNFNSAYVPVKSYRLMAFRLLSCSGSTTSYPAFLKAADLPPSFMNASLAARAFLHYQDAYPEKVFAAMKTFVAFLNVSNYYEAGRNLYPLINLLKNITDISVIEKNKAIAIYNGIFLNYGMRPPVEIKNCILASDESITSLTRFYVEWGKVGQNIDSTGSNSWAVTQSYFNGKGKEYIESVSPRLMQCILLSNNNKNFMRASSTTLYPLDPSFQMYIQKFIQLNNDNAYNYKWLIQHYDNIFELGYYTNGGAQTQIYSPNLLKSSVPK